MSQHDTLVGGVGTVRVGDLEITITPLSQAEETLLDRRLMKAGADLAGDNYTRCAGVLKAAEANPADRLEMVKEIARVTIGQGDKEGKAPLSGSAFFEFRFGPDGLPIELLARGKRATPGLTLEGLRAVVTAANADEVAGQLIRVIEQKGPSGKE